MRLVIFAVVVFLLPSICLGQIKQARPVTSAIVWENVQLVYESFADVKPLIVNESKKTIFLREPDLVIVRIFDEEGQKWWYSKYKLPQIDSFGLKYKFIKFKSKKRLDLTKELAWNYTLVGHCFPCDGIPTWEEIPDYRTGRKYKLIVYYFLKTGGGFVSESPEFWVKPKQIK